MTGPWYDTKEGFEKALKNGLGGLKEIANERHKAGYDRKERLGTWCVLGYFMFDACGNTMKITEGRPDYYTFGKTLPRVLTKEELDTGKLHGCMSMTMGSIPPTVEVCPRCLEGWTLQNVSDYEPVHRNGEWTHYHQRCHDLKITQSEIEFFDEILKESGIKFSGRRIIPAEYPDRPTAPWFMVETDKGPVKIGYRRHVISIEWEHSQIEHDGEELFKNESTTKGKALVHAWGKEKAAEYLRKLLGEDSAVCP